MKYKLKDLQIVGRYYGVDVEFENEEEITGTLKQMLFVEGNETKEDYDKLPLWELLEIFGYEVETVKKTKYKFYYYVEKTGTGTVEADTIEEARELIEQSTEQCDDIVYNDDEILMRFQICDIAKERG